MASSAIWLLTTRGRPQAAQQVLDACEATGMTSPGIVYVDETVDAYAGLRLPANWQLHAEPVWGSIGASMRYVYERWPAASHYGWLADDTLPRTYGWDSQLEAAAGSWRLAYADDLWISRLSGDQYCWPEELRAGRELGAGLCWGGDLVRAVGWWCPPWLTQAGIDTTWTAIISPLQLAAYTPAVVVEHATWRSGKRPRDQGDEWVRPGAGNYVERDIAARDAWVASPRYRDLRRRLRAAVPAGARG